MQNLGQNIRKIVAAFVTAGKPLNNGDVLELLPDISPNPRRKRQIESVRTYLNRGVALGLLSREKGANGACSYTLSPYYKSIMAQYEPEKFVPIATKVVGRVIPQSARPDISSVWRFPVGV